MLNNKKIQIKRISKWKGTRETQEYKQNIESRYELILDYWKMKDESHYINTYVVLLLCFKMNEEGIWVKEDVIFLGKLD